MGSRARWVRGRDGFAGAMGSNAPTDGPRIETEKAQIKRIFGEINYQVLAVNFILKRNPSASVPFPFRSVAHCGRLTILFAMDSSFDISQFRSVAVLTGAGISVASGLSTFRDESGNVLASMPEDWLWASDARNLPGSLDRVWAIYGSLRGLAATVEPNIAHTELARWQQVLEGSGGELTIITQNVDELHQKAGSRDVLELHGSLLRSLCTRVGCPNAAPFHDERPFDHAPPCDICGSPLRPDIVLFGEALSDQVLGSAGLACIRADLFIALGTSATVAPASKLASVASRNGALCVFVNPAPDAPDGFDLHIREKSEDAAARWLAPENLSR